MTEAEFQIVKSIGFVLALALAAALQRWSPHRALAGSWRANSGLWALNAAVLGTICAGCACTVSRWASGGGFGLLNQGVASAWIALKGGAWETGMRQRIYRLDEVVPVRPVPGALRLATMDDLALLTEWGVGFARDAGHAFLLEPEQISRMIGRQDLRIWQDETPASMAVAQGATPNGCRVGYVYTPPELRGRGYASALVADLSQRMLDSGFSFCVLYTDLANATSNAIYERIGYNAIGDVRDIHIVSRPLAGC